MYLHTVLICFPRPYLCTVLKVKSLSSKKKQMVQSRYGALFMSNGFLIFTPKDRKDVSYYLNLKNATKDERTHIARLVDKTPFLEVSVTGTTQAAPDDQCAFVVQTMNCGKEVLVGEPATKAAPSKKVNPL